LFEKLLKCREEGLPMILANQLNPSKFSIKHKDQIRRDHAADPVPKSSEGAEAPSRLCAQIVAGYLAGGGGAAMPPPGAMGPAAPLVG
jgi:hypothetical protein